MTPSQRTEALRQIGWSQRDLARALNIAEGTVRGWQRGHRDPPPRVDDWLERLASFCAWQTATINSALEARAATWAAQPAPRCREPL